jgi:hypothetical protein
MKRKKQLTGKDLLLDICNYPNKYYRVINVPCWYDAAQALIEMGCKLGLNQRPAIMRRELLDNQIREIAAETNWNLN